MGKILEKALNDKSVFRSQFFDKHELLKHVIDGRYSVFSQESRLRQKLINLNTLLIKINGKVKALKGFTRHTFGAIMMNKNLGINLRSSINLRY